MAEVPPIVLAPGLLCSARLYAPQVMALWSHGSVTVADHRREDDIKAVAAHILRDAPPRFALIGLSYGGYLAFEIMRQAADRVVKLALLDTSARPDTPEQTAARYAFITMAEEGRLSDVVDTLYPRFVHKDRRGEKALRDVVDVMVAETGPEAFVRQEKAIISRPDSRPMLANIKCPTLVLVGDADELTPPDIAREIAGSIAGAKLVVVPECGHLATLERPEAVNAALAAWLES
jgi:pimeloyl-ACP methyl ester carboxylesterase